MKRRKKLDVIISVVAIVVGGILMSWGIAHKGMRSVVWDSADHKLVVNQTVSRTSRPAAYQKIVVDTKLPVTIRRSNVSRVTVQQQNFNRKRQPVTTTVRDHTLTIRGGDSRQHNVIFHGPDITRDDEAFDTSGRIIVEVPQRTSVQQVTLQKSWTVRLEDLTFKQITGPTGGSFQAKNVTVKQALDLRQGDADVYLTNVTAPQLQLHTDDGDVDVKQSRFTSRDNLISSDEGDVTLATTQLGGGRVTTGDGDVHIRSNDLAHHLTVTSSEGDLSGLVAADAGVTANGTSDSEITLFGRSRKSGTQIRPHAKVQYTFSVGDDGDITVR